jgi:hypothetical protein
MARFRDIIFPECPYETFEAEKYEGDMQGWSSDHPALKKLVQGLRPELIIEVGSWKGRSAINMAKYAAEVGLATEIICVDTWLGSPEHWLNKEDPNFYQSLKIQNGTPTFYYTFLKNVVDNKLQDVITPFRVPSETAYFILRRLNIRAKLIYIDAGHEYESVLNDLNMYTRLLTDDGVICGDDYIMWESVTRAVNEFAVKNPGFTLIGEKHKFVLGKKISLEYKI